MPDYLFYRWKEHAMILDQILFFFFFFFFLLFLVKETSGILFSLTKS